MNSSIQRDRSQVRSIIESHRYVYLPLHLQPEATTSPLAGLLCDQLLFVEAVCAAAKRYRLKVLVKENPKQIPHLRGAAFWRDVAALDGVIVLDTSVDTFEMIKGSKLVATLNGTAGWEASCLGIPVLAHESAVYVGAPGVSTFSQLSEISELFEGCITALPRVDESWDPTGFLRAMQTESVAGRGLNTAPSTASSQMPDQACIDDMVGLISVRLRELLFPDSPTVDAV